MKAAGQARVAVPIKLCHLGIGAELPREMGLRSRQGGSGKFLRSLLLLNPIDECSEWIGWASTVDTATGTVVHAWGNEEPKEVVDPPTSSTHFVFHLLAVLDCIFGEDYIIRLAVPHQEFA